MEFSAAEGFVGLPKKVARCLFGLGEGGLDEDWEDRMRGRIKVTYKRLQKGTRAVFQPRIKEFQATLNASPGIDIKSCLEACLSTYSCLAVGDWVTVTLEEREFDLRVKELEVAGEAADACSIIDTDLEAEVHPSIETEEKIFQEELQARQLMEAREQAEREAEQAEREAEQARETERAALVETMRVAASRLAEVAEPAAGDVGVTSVMVRGPDGGRWRRHFRADDEVDLLFSFVDANGASGLMPGQYNLVSQYPRVEIRDDQGGRLGEVTCFGSGSLTLFIEKKGGH